MKIFKKKKLWNVSIWLQEVFFPKFTSSLWLFSYLLRYGSNWFFFCTCRYRRRRWWTWRRRAIAKFHFIIWNISVKPSSTIIQIRWKFFAKIKFIIFISSFHCSFKYWPIGVHRLALFFNLGVDEAMEFSNTLIVFIFWPILDWEKNDNIVEKIREIAQNYTELSAWKCCAISRNF